LQFDYNKFIITLLAYFHITSVLEHIPTRKRGSTLAIEPCGDNFIPVVPVEYELHTPEKPFCYDAACDCHEDDVAIFQVSLHVQDGLMTPDEATGFVKGKGI
jgi:hypothetical protein